jgi:hypothetical protein
MGDGKENGEPGIPADQVKDIKPQPYVVDFIMCGKEIVRVPLFAPNDLSVAAVAAAITAANIEAVYGFTLYRATDATCQHDPRICKDLVFVAYSPIMDILAQITPQLSRAAGRPLSKTVVQVINPTSEQFKKMMEAQEALRRGQA